VQELGLSDHVTFTGHRSDIREIYAASRAVLSLSTQPESFGRSVLEALAIGTPVLGFDHGGVGEVLGELNPQGLVPLGDTAALVNRAEELLARPKHLVPPFEKYRLTDSLSAEVDLYEQMAAAQVAKSARAAA
jgi:glycosyltransferase involved in cell wall biosynthesis